MKCQKVVEETRAFLEILGIDTRRLHLKWISAAEGAVFADEIAAFTEVLDVLGDNPLQARRQWDQSSADTPRTAGDPKPLLLTKNELECCMECSICTGTCPVSREHPSFSPKQILKQATMHLDTELIKSRELWSCLGCGHCSIRCPALIDFPFFNRSYRVRAFDMGMSPLESHHGIHQAIAQMQTRPVRQQRVNWAEGAGRFHSQGEFFYFVGCLPYYDITFKYLDLSPLRTARSVLSLLNRIQIEPVISSEERCCGHDALWTGDVDTFKSLAQWNLETILGSGAKTVLFACPEGYATFKYDYPEYVGKLPFEVIYITELLATELLGGETPFMPSPGEVLTYQDPCRLGRRSGIYDSPRRLLKAVPGAEVLEMERTRDNALCCGTSAWMECTSCSKAIQSERLMEAEETGASRLITSCPKCQIHFTCAQSREDFKIGVTDIYTYLLERLEGKNNGVVKVSAPHYDHTLRQRFTGACDLGDIQFI